MIMKNGIALNNLRMFEAAGRHLSFTRAAEELGVLQPAVSRQVIELGLEKRILDGMPF